MVTQLLLNKILAHASNPNVASFFNDMQVQVMVAKDRSLHALESPGHVCACKPKNADITSLYFGNLLNKSFSFAPCFENAIVFFYPYQNFLNMSEFLKVLERFTCLIKQEIPIDSFEDLLGMIRELLKFSIMSGPAAFEMISSGTTSKAEVSVFSASLAKAAAERFNKETLNFICAPPEPRDLDGKSAFKFIAFGAGTKMSPAVVRYFNGIPTTLSPKKYARDGLENLIKFYFLDALILSRKVAPYSGDYGRTQITLLSEHEAKAVNEMSVLKQSVHAPEVKLTDVEFDLMRMLAKNQIESQPPVPRGSGSREVDFQWVRPTLQAFEALKD